MAIFHLEHKFLRRQGRLSVSLTKAAYNAGERLEDATGSALRSDYSNRGGVLYREVAVSAGSPSWAKERETLWSRLELREDRSTRRSEAVLAHNFTMALPYELTLEQNIFLVKDFVREQFSRKGYVADWAIHAADPRGDQRNIHLHLLVPLRKIEGDSFGRKIPTNKHQHREQVVIWRTSWAKLTNRHLKRYGHKATVDERTLKAQGSKRIPTRHHGIRSKTSKQSLDPIRLPEPKAPALHMNTTRGADGLVSVQATIHHSALNHIGHSPRPAYAIKLMPTRADTSDGGWPPEAISMWKAWGQRDPIRFFAIWRELAPPNFDFSTGGHIP